MFAGPLGRSTFTPPKSSFDSPLYGLVSLRRSHRSDPKDALLMRGKGRYRSDSYFVSHLIAFDSIAPHPKSGVFGPCGRAERGSALELVGRVSLFQGSFSPVAGFGDQMPGLLVGVAAVAEKLRYAADVPWFRVLVFSSRFDFMIAPILPSGWFARYEPDDAGRARHRPRCFRPDW